MKQIPALLVVVAILGSMLLIAVGMAVYSFGSVLRGQRLMRAGATVALWAIGSGFVIGAIIRGGVTEGQLLRVAFVLALSLLLVWVVKRHRKG